MDKEFAVTLSLAEIAEDKESTGNSPNFKTMSEKGKISGQMQQQQQQRQQFTYKNNDGSDKQKRNDDTILAELSGISPPPNEMNDDNSSDDGDSVGGDRNRTGTVIAKPQLQSPSANEEKEKEKEFVDTDDAPPPAPPPDDAPTLAQIQQTSKEGFMTYRGSMSMEEKEREKERENIHNTLDLTAPMNREGRFMTGGKSKQQIQMICVCLCLCLGVVFLSAGCDICIKFV